MRPLGILKQLQSSMAVKVENGSTALSLLRPYKALCNTIATLYACIKAWFLDTERKCICCCIMPYKDIVGWRDGEI